MIPILGIALTLVIGLPVIAANTIYIAELEAEKPKPVCLPTGSPNRGCPRRDK